MKAHLLVVASIPLVLAGCGGGDDFDEAVYEAMVEAATLEAEFVCPDVRLVEREPDVAERRLGVTSLEELVRAEMAITGVNQETVDENTDETVQALRDVCEESNDGDTEGDVAAESEGCEAYRRTLEVAIEAFFASSGTYPTTGQELVDAGFIREYDESLMVVVTTDNAALVEAGPDC